MSSETVPFIFSIVIEVFWLLFLLGVIYVLLRPVINGAVYFPSSDENIKAMLALAGVKPGDKVADLGSGDGRILIALANAGVDATGYEVNPLLVLRSRRKIRELGLQRKVEIRWKSFWRENLSPFDIVIVYGIPHIMKKLEEKLKREMKPTAGVISNIYPFPGWRPERTEGRVFLYRNRTTPLVETGKASILKTS